MWGPNTEKENPQKKNPKQTEQETNKNQNSKARALLEAPAEMYFMWNRSPRGVKKTKRMVESCDRLTTMIAAFLQTCSKAKTNERGLQTRTGA